MTAKKTTKKKTGPASPERLLNVNELWMQVYGRFKNGRGCTEAERLLLEKAFKTFLRGTLAQVLAFDELSVPSDVKEEDLRKKIDELEFSVRTANALERAGIRTVRDLASKSEVDILRIRDLGRKALKEIRWSLAQLHLTLGMKLPPERGTLSVFNPAPLIALS